MLALLALEVELKEEEDEPPKFVFAAMPQSYVHGKQTHKGIFKRLYALLYKTYDHTSDYALSATIVLGIPIPRIYKKAIRSQYIKE